jgi:hypothetical protein
MSTSSELISSPIVDRPELAKDKAVGRPIRPIPITHILSDPDCILLLNSDSLISKRFFIAVLQLHIIYLFFSFINDEDLKIRKF